MDASPDLDAVIGYLYDAALDPARWPSAMTALGQAFRSHVGAVMFVLDAKGRSTRILGSDDRQDSIDDYIAHWATPSATECGAARPRRADARGVIDIARATQALRPGELCTDDMLVGRATLERSPFYNEHLRKFDYHHAVGGKIWDEPTGSGLISLSRSRLGGPFADADFARLRLLQPHLQRALTISQRLAWTQAGGHAAEDGFARAAFATLLLDQSGSCGYANAAAETLLALNDGIAMVRGRLRAESGAADDSLARGIALAVKGDASGSRSGTAVWIPRRSVATGLALIVAPIGLAHHWFLPQSPRAIVTVVDPEDRRAPASARLAALFRLTPSEAAVAAGVGKGRELKDVASELRLTADSARQYLTRIYAKTGTRRQNDLCHLLTRIGLA